MKCLLMQVVPVTPCHVCVSSETFCLLVPALEVLEYCDEFPPLDASSAGRKGPTPSGFSHRADSQPHDHLCVFPLDTPVCLCLSWALSMVLCASWQRLSRVGWGHLHLCQPCPCRCSPGSSVPLLPQQCAADPASLSTRTPRSLSAKLLPSHTVPGFTELFSYSRAGNVMIGLHC